MYPNQINRRFLALGIVLLILGLGAGALWDLPIDQAVHSPANLAAILMECFGFYPLYLPLLLLCASLGGDAARPLSLRWGCGLGAAGITGGLLLYSLSHLEKRGVEHSLLWALGVWCVLLALYWILRSMERARTDAWRRRERFVLFWGSVYMVMNLALVNLLKWVWNRTRFDDMLAAGDFSAFTSWLEPFGSGGSSFPSGHTAAACGVFVLVLLCDIWPAWHRRRTVIWAACWAYVAGMAVSRLVMGRHFLSDTVAAAALMSALFWAMTRSRAYQRSLQQLGPAPQDPPGGSDN